MKLFRRTAGVLIILAALSLFAYKAYSATGYRFDDPGGTSGVSLQWMILNSLSNGSNTFGANHVVSMEVSADFVNSSYEEGIYVLNGEPDSSTVANREASVLYFILGEGDGTYTFSFRSPTNINQAEAEAIGGNINFGTDTGAIRSRYRTQKVAHESRVDSNGQFWLDYTFTFAPLQGSDTKYDTVREYLAFNLNPQATPSQTKQLPVVIANVNKETALDEKLELRMALRDASTNGNIVAYKRDTWNASDKKDTSSTQWILVPVEDINYRHAYYYLTTELANHTSYRYAAQDLNNDWIFPDYWKFDLPRYVGTNNITRHFYLDPMSHAAPGLVSVYNRRRYDVGEENKRPFGVGLYGIDDTGEGMWELVFNNNVLFCNQVGSKYEYGTDSTYNQIEIIAFEPNPASQNFYENVADVTGSTKTITPSSSFTQSSITRESPTSEALEYFTINHAIPGSLRSDSVEGMLPLHITLNIPVTRIQDYEWWNDMVDEWRSSGEINEIFAKNLAIYAMADDKNIWNMSQELTEKGVYDSQVKIFLDEERGRATYDNDRGVITVSFMILLMNGTRDGERPEMSVVTDSSNTGFSQNYLVIRDGTDDSRWKLTFFIAPATYQTNETDSEDNNTDTNNVGGGGGGGGCNSGAGLLFVIIPGLVMLSLNRKHKI
ncbi:MAG: hypothetical protein IJP48_01270 [Synergistaceae bacterium]|nr:hypothetical protein [Synergistaceae bacterium]